MKNILLTALFVFSVSAGVFAQEQAVKKSSLFFRYGKILSAEACSSRPVIKDPTLIMNRTKDSLYVQIIFRPDAGRSLSMHDFALADSSGKEYKCIAVAQGDVPYSGITWNYQYLDEKPYCRMLFAVPSAEGEFTLKFKLFGTRVEENKFKLKSVNEFSAAASIPADGRLILPEPPPPPPPPEPPAEKKEAAEGENKDAGAAKDSSGEKKSEEAAPKETPADLPE